MDASGKILHTRWDLPNLTLTAVTEGRVLMGAALPPDGCCRCVPDRGTVCDSS